MSGIQSMTLRAAVIAAVVWLLLHLHLEFLLRQASNSRTSDRRRPASQSRFSAQFVCGWSNAQRHAVNCRSRREQRGRCLLA
jgi:hypothetical protein